ncbi:hypothetical protein [Nocardioides sp. AE5]|uniref:hypothetical protein n=1 Tax=Nocardioides sp. AE5 TaxID=2962573 RepID=UPI00288150C6|nr:hypothetical protein [Nocardioides sp. AE5]MDT0202835.1 hypothetical protein [Nocardioides sp. AE5]
MSASRVSRRVALAAAARALGQSRLHPVGKRFGGARTDLWRVRDEDGRALVVKAYRDPDSNTWRREAAGLATARGARGPELLAQVADPALVVMGDLGIGPTLADQVLGRDRPAAVAATRAWARALGELHAHTLGRAEVFTAHLGDDVAPAVVADEVDRLPALLEALVSNHDLPTLPSLGRLLSGPAGRLADPAHWVITPGDTCPDNNLFTDSGAWLLDFEFAEARHPAWDAAYLRVPWPTCWCAWQLPTEVADDALVVYRSATGIDWITADGFAADVEAATLLWCLVSSAMFLGDALTEQGDGGNARRPGRRTMVLYRLALASRITTYAELAAYAGELGEALTRRWGPHPLAMAPAFAG